MADGTHIQWTDSTWNFLTGCTRVSDGCLHCYIDRTPPFRMSGRRFDGDGIGATTGVLYHPDRLELPLRWRKPRRIFVNSLSDILHDDVPEDVIARAFAVMALAPQHTFQVLTKRHARLRSLVADDGFRDLVTGEIVGLVNEDPKLSDEHLARALPDWWPLANVWLGVSVESQQWADIRIPALLATPAAVRFLSCEPLLGPVDLAGFLPRAYDAPWYQVECRHGHDGCPICDRPMAPEDSIGWVIAGGESGPGARPMHPDWARGLRDQCAASGVPFHFKQYGEWREDVYVDADGDTRWAGQKPEPKDPRRMALHPMGMTALTADNPFDPFTMGHPHWTIMRRTAHKSERDLDGRTWDEFPAPREVTLL